MMEFGVIVIFFFILLNVVWNYSEHRLFLSSEQMNKAVFLWGKLFINIFNDCKIIMGPLLLGIYIFLKFQYYK